MVGFLRGRPRPIFALADVIHGAGATMEEPPWSCGPRTSSNTRGDRPCYRCGSIPVTGSRGFLRGWPQLKIALGARSPAAPMTRNNQPLGLGGREGGSPSANGAAEQQNSGRNAEEARRDRTKQRNTTINSSGNTQQHTHPGRGEDGGNRGPSAILSGLAFIQKLSPLLKYPFFGICTHLQPAPDTML